MACTFYAIEVVRAARDVVLIGPSSIWGISPNQRTLGFLGVSRAWDLYIDSSGPKFGFLLMWIRV